MIEDEVYVMLMMMRADEGYTPNEKCSLEEMVACALADDTDACLAACTGNEEEEQVGNGLVTISKVSAAAQQEVAMNASKKNVGTVKLTAGPDGAIVSSVVVKRSGLWSNDVSVQLQNKAWTVVTSARSANSNGEAVVRFSPALTLKANESMSFDVLVNLLPGIWANETHSFAVIGANLANGTANGSANLWTLKTTSYVVTPATVSLSTTTATINAWEDAKTINRITITPSKKSTINGFTLTKVGGAQDFDKFGEIKAYYNNAEIGKVVITSDKIVVSNLNIEKDASTSAQIELKATSNYIWPAASNTTDINFETTADIDVVEVETKESVQMATIPTTALTVTFGAVNLDIEKTTEKSETVAPGATEVVLYEAKVSSSTEFDVVEYELVAWAWDSALIDWKIILYVDWSPIELYQNAAKHVKDPVFDWTNTWTFTTNDLFTVTPRHPVTIRVVGNVISDISTATPADLIQSYTFNINKVRDVENTSNVLAGTPLVSEAWDTVTIAEGTLTLKTATLAAPSSLNLWANWTNLEASRFAIRASNENITVTKVVFNKNAAFTDSLKNVISSAKLVNAKTDEVIASNGKINANDIEFSSINLSAIKDEDVNVKLVITTKGFNYASLAVKTLQLTPVIAAADTNRDSGWSATVTWTPTVNTYTFGVKSPEVTMEKVNDNLFKVTVKNVDTENAITLQSVDVRVKPLSNDADYEWIYVLREEWSSIKDPTVLATNYAAWNSTDPNSTAWEWVIPGAATTFTFVTAQDIVKNGGTYTFELYVDSNYVNPTTLVAEFTNATYAEWTENYDISAK